MTGAPLSLHELLHRAAPAPRVLMDAHGRVKRKLRISLTDRCNFRCRYCMPAEGMPWLDRSQILSFEEIERLVSLLAKLGITDVRLTGPHLSVLGGSSLSQVGAAAAVPAAVFDFDAVTASRERHIGWDTPWVRALTPWHFDLGGTSDDKRLLGMLQAQLVKLAVLFTCDRARARRPSSSCLRDPRLLLATPEPLLRRYPAANIWQPPQVPSDCPQP